MEIVDRVKSKTPPFFKKVRKVALALTAIAGCVLTADAEGSLAFPEWLVTGSKYIYMLLPRRVGLRNPVSRKIYSTAYKNYKSLPFAERWLTSYDNFNRSRVRFALRELMNAGGVIAYPPLADEKGSYVAQYEHTFIITEKEEVIVTTQPPFDFEQPESLQKKADNDKDENQPPKTE